MCLFFNSGGMFMKNKPSNNLVPPYDIDCRVADNSDDNFNYTIEDEVQRHLMHCMNLFTGKIQFESSIKFQLVLHM